MRYRLTHLLALVAVLVITGGCGGNSTEDLAGLPTVAILPTLSPTPTASPTEPATETPIPTATETEVPTEVIPPTETATQTATTAPTATVDVTVTAYYATQHALATANAEIAVALETLDAAGLVPTATATPFTVATLDGARIFYTVDGGVRVRSCPFISDECSDIVPELDVNLAVVVVGTTMGDTFRDSPEWYQIDVDGVTGYVHSSLVNDTPLTPVPPEADQTATAVAQP